MTPRQHITSTRVLAPPAGVSLDECQALAITDCVADGMPSVASYWYPDANELALLNEGRGVCVVITGRTHPPIRVGVDIFPTT